MTAADPAKQLAKEIATLRREVNGLSRGSQMRFRSIDGGSIPVYDSDGSYRGQIGQLRDGTVGFEVIAGPKPPRPSAPIIFPLIGGLEITWNGETFDGSPLPGDFRCVEVHAAPYSVFDPDESTLRASLIQGGTITLSLPAQPWTIMFVIRSTAGVLSDPSIPATETPEHAPTAAEIDEARSAAQTAQQAADAANAKALEAAGIAAGKGRVYTQPDPPGPDANGLWIDTDNGNLPHRWDGTNNVWVPVRDTGIQDAANAAAAAQSRADAAYTQATTATQKADQALLDAAAAATAANGKNKVFWRESNNPPPNPLIENDLWFVTDLGNRPRIYKSGSWQDATFQDGAIAGLNVGKLTAGQIAAGQRIIAGQTTGTHAEMSDDGFRVFLEDPVDGVPDEIVRMGTRDNDIIGISDSSGKLIASIDSAGGINGQALNITGDPVFGGAPLSRTLSEVGGKVVGNWKGNIQGLEQAGASGIGDTEYGIAQFTFPVTEGRAYRIEWRLPFCYVSEAVGEVWQRIIYKINGTPTPSDHREAGIRLFSGYPPASWLLETLPGYFEADTTGTCTAMLVMRHAWGSATPSVLKIVEGAFTWAQAYDVGPATESAGGQTSGYGSLIGPPPPPPPPPTQNYFVELAPAGAASYRGNGTLRTDTTDIVQGPDPSGYNGDGQGHWWFSLPSITGTITNMEFYAYANHTYYSNGGDGLLTPTILGNGGPNYGQPRAKWNAGRWPKPGGRTVQLPADWWPMFTNGGAYGFGRADGIRVGNGDGNLRNYVRFDRNSARLRIWYTQ